MYSYDERMRAVQLYIKYDKNIAAVIHELGYPTRQMLYLWYKEFTTKGSLRSDVDCGYSKYDLEQRKQAVEYYLNHGRSVSRTIMALGYPRRTALCRWINDALPASEKRCIASKSLVRCTQEQQEQAVIRLCAGEGTAKEIASEFGVTESSLNRWKKSLLNKGCATMVRERQLRLSAMKKA